MADQGMGSQMELRMIQKRNRDDTVRARDAGEPKQRPSYGYMYVRLIPMGKVDHVEIDPVAAEVIRNVARRILADETGTITHTTESARLNRERVPSPGDRRAELYGRPVRGMAWHPNTLKHILRSEAALGYLMHGTRPVLGDDGRPVRLAEPLWDRSTHEALLVKTGPKRAGSRAPEQGKCSLAKTAALGSPEHFHVALCPGPLVHLQHRPHEHAPRAREHHDEGQTVRSVPVTGFPAAGPAARNRPAPAPRPRPPHRHLRTAGLLRDTRRHLASSRG